MALEPRGALCDWVYILFPLMTQSKREPQLALLLQPLNIALGAAAQLHQLSNQNKCFTGNDWQQITMHCWLAKNGAGPINSTDPRSIFQRTNYTVCVCNRSVIRYVACSSRAGKIIFNQRYRKWRAAIHRVGPPSEREKRKRRKKKRQPNKRYR